MITLDYNNILKTLSRDPNYILPIQQVYTICSTTYKIVKHQPVCLELSVPVNICGDIHGQFQHLKMIFTKFGYPPKSPYLFLGDYVDRGEHSLSVILFLFILKILYPHYFFLLRGNHECPTINELYGFQEECIRLYGKTDGKNIWKWVNNVFQWLPLSAIIENTILCLHGGLSPSLKSLTQLKSIDRSVIKEIPEKGLECDLLWSDPDKLCTGWNHNEDRGVSYTFCPQIVKQFCDENNIELICRAHQVVDNGYEFFCERRLLTLFSAPNYCNSMNNKGSVATVDTSMNITIKEI